MRSSTRYTVGRDTENSSADSAIVFPALVKLHQVCLLRGLGLWLLAAELAFGAGDGHALVGT